jgi:hypothetical protein
MVGTKPAIEWTTFVNFRRELQRDCPRLVIRRDLHVQIRIAKEQGFELSVLGTFLADEDFPISKQDTRVDDLATLRANGLGQLPEYFLAVFLYGNGFHEFSDEIVWVN